MNPSDVPAWLQAGGLVAFAAAVWFEQRSIRNTLDTMREMLSALIERDRIERKRAPTNPTAE